MATNYKEISRNARLRVLEMVFKAQSSHIGSNFSVIDMLTVLFEKADLNKDKIILSAGWKAASFYYFLAEKGFFPKEWLDTYNQSITTRTPVSKFIEAGFTPVDKSLEDIETTKPGPLIGLTEPGVPGVHFAGGSMGMGLPASVGFALSKKMRGEDGVVYCIMSDGELNSGTTWESALIASHHGLNNLAVFVDKNGFQAMGKTDDILEVGFPNKGWGVHAIDGHDLNMIDRAIYAVQSGQFRPTCFIANTIKGRGVMFMENENEWHYRNIPEDLYEKAKKYLDA